MMVKKHSLLLVIVHVSISFVRAKEKDPVEHVNTLQGTNSKHELTRGNTDPTPALPFGMHTWTPQTGKNGDGWKCQYFKTTIRGFQQAHQCSSWTTDCYVFSFMPLTGKSTVNENERATGFSHDNKVAKPPQGNQPILHMIYLYNYAGQPWKTQYWAREVMDRLYKPTPDGYCGDGDNGQTSAWYVFSAMCYYPVCPGTQQYVLGAPLFNRVTVSFDNGKKLVINAPNNREQNSYVQAVNFNGKAQDKNWLNHFDLQKGGTLNFTMGVAPNKTRGRSAAAYPYSFSTENPPLVIQDKTTFNK